MQPDRAGPGLLAHRALPAVLAAAAALIVFAPALAGGYIYDDLFLVHLDPRLAEISRWGEFWTRDYYNGGLDNLYRPLVSMSYAVQFKLHGDRPWAFHLVNWLLHAGAAAAVAELARRMAGARVALIAGLLFAVHPVHVEAVGAIVGRAELMCMLATAMALLLLLGRPMTMRRALAVWACGVAALLSKEQGILLPVMLGALWLLHIRWSERRDALATAAKPAATTDPPGETPPATPLEYGSRPLKTSPQVLAARVLALSILWTWAAYLVLREQVLELRFWWERAFLDWSLNPLVREDSDRWLVPLSLIGRSAAMLVAPHRLSVDYSGLAIGWRASLSDPYLIAGVAVAAIAAAALGVALWRRNGLVAFALIALGLSYGMVSNLPALIGTIFAERLLYMPSAFFLLIAAAALSRLSGRWAAGIVVAIALAWSVQTFRYAMLWRDPADVLVNSIEHQPGAVRLYVLLGEELARRGELEASDRAMAQGRALIPDYAYVWYRSALMAAHRGDFEAADRYLAETMRLDPRYVGPGVQQMIRQRRSPLAPDAPAPSP